MKERKKTLIPREGVRLCAILPLISHPLGPTLSYLFLTTTEGRKNSYSNKLAQPFKQATQIHTADRQTGVVRTVLVRLDYNRQKLTQHLLPFTHTILFSS
jgi:hypothetical protein